MKKLLGILVLGLLWCNLSIADNISDFEIEGMSLGDSALKYYSESKIKANKQNWYKGKKYSTSTMAGGIQISYKTKDSEYILQGIEFSEFMDISKCLEELPSQVDAVRTLFSDKIKLNGPNKYKHWADKSKKSWIHNYIFEFPGKDKVTVECYDWSKNVTWNDNFRLSIVSKGFMRFLDKQ